MKSRMKESHQHRGDEENDSGPAEQQEETETTSPSSVYQENVFGSSIFVAMFEQRKLAYRKNQEQEKQRRKLMNSHS